MLKKITLSFLIGFLGIQSCRSQTMIDALKEELTRKQKSYVTKTIKHQRMTLEVPVFGDSIFDSVLEELYETSKKEDNYLMCYESGQGGEIEVFFEVTAYTGKLLCIEKSVQFYDCGFAVSSDYQKSYNYMKYRSDFLKIKPDPSFAKRESTILEVKGKVDPDCADIIDKDGLDDSLLIFSENKGYLMGLISNRFCETYIPIEINDENIIFEKIDLPLKK